MTSGQDTARSLVEKYTARIAQIDRQGPALRSVIELNPDAVTIADELRCRTQAEGRARSAARRSDPDQGQHRHGRSHDDDRRLAGAGRRPGAARRVSRRAAARRGRGDSRQDEPERVGELSIDALDQRLERARRPDEEPLRARSKPVRLQLRIGRRGRGEPRRRRDRHGNRRLHRLPRAQHLARRIQADARAREPHRHRADRAQPGHRGADDSNGGRCRGNPERARRRRRRRSGHGGSGEPCVARLHGSARSEGPPGRAHRGRARQAVRLQPGGRSAGRGRHRRHEEARARSSSTRRTSRRSDPSTPANWKSCSTSSRPT